MVCDVACPHLLLMYSLYISANKGSKNDSVLPDPVPDVMTVVEKIKNLDIRIICPLHGPVLKDGIDKYVEKYNCNKYLSK